MCKEWRTDVEYGSVLSDSLLRPPNGLLALTPTGGGMEHELFQLFDTDSSTFTYVLVDRATREAIVVDSVDARFDREIALLRRLGLTLRYVVETHTHADHVTAAGRLREATGALAATPFGCGIPPADVQLAHGDVPANGIGAAKLALRQRVVDHRDARRSGAVGVAQHAPCIDPDAEHVEVRGADDFEERGAPIARIGGTAPVDAVRDAVSPPLQR